MNPLSNHCGAQRALIYCRWDAVRLCLPRDANIHSANTISSRHIRAQLCDCCHSQQADFLCLDNRLALCGLTVDPNSCIPVSLYSDCRTSAEYSAIVSATSDLTVDSYASWETPSIFDVGLSGLDNPMEFEPTWILSSSSCIAPNLISVFPSG